MVALTIDLRQEITLLVREATAAAGIMTVVATGQCLLP
jgi:hypothetical protein